MADTNALKDGSHLYEVEFSAHHLERPGFRISELSLSKSQTVPWHAHTNVSDTFYVLAGEMCLFLQAPKEQVRLTPGKSFCVDAGRAHLVTNAGEDVMSFLVLQGIGEYDYIPLVNSAR